MSYELFSERYVNDNYSVNIHTKISVWAKYLIP